jgi:nitroreductase
MTNLPELMRQRRTVNLFTTQAVSDALIAQLLETAVYAPNHKLSEPWRFVLLDSAAKLEYAALRRDYAHQQGKNPQSIYQMFLQIPAFVFVIMHESADKTRRDEDLAATAALIQNLILLAEDAGLASKWSSFPDLPEFRAWLGLTERESVVGVIHLGYPAQIPPNKGRTPAQERISILKGR